MKAQTRAEAAESFDRVDVGSRVASDCEDGIAKSSHPEKSPLGWALASLDDRRTPRHD
jgi:hypothetical protein